MSKASLVCLPLTSHWGLIPSSPWSGPSFLGTPAPDTRVEQVNACDQAGSERDCNFSVLKCY